MRIHIVKKGDSLYLIGQKYNVSLEEILKLNPGITNPDAIEVGMKLKIPSSHTGGSGGGMDIMHQHIVKQGDTLWKLSKAWGVPLADMIKANPQLKNPNVLLTGEVVNIPKVNTVDEDAGGHGAGHGMAQGTSGAHMLHPTSIMQGVQGWVGKLSTAPITGKTPTGPITGKTPTAPIAPAPVAPTPVAPAPVAPVQEKKPTAPIVKPVAPAPLPAPKAAAVEPAKKALPIEKPVEKKLKPIHSEYKPNVDLFKQYGIPATEALSLYDLPKAPESVSPAQQQPTYGGYGYGQPMTMPAQMGHGYGHPMTMPAQMEHGYGYGNWQQPVPFGSTVSPLSEGNEAPFDCPPGTVFVGSYPSPSTMPLGAGAGWGYGYPGVSPLQHDVNENNHMVAGASAHPNQGFVSPLSAQPNQGMVLPLMAQPNQGMVSPLMAQPNQGMVSPLMAQPNQGMVSPLSAQPNQGMVSPLMAQPNQGMVSPLMAQPNQGMVSPLMAQPNQGMVSPLMAQPNQGMVSPAGMHPDYGYGYGYGHGGHGMVMPAQAQHDGGYGYGYPSYPHYPGWPQTAGAFQSNQDDCGCKGHRSDQASAKLADTDIEKPAKTVVQKKNGKKAVIRTVSSRPNKPKNRGNQPWINR
ncbi:LysM peptidoglycan-binding domain-containing protein [Paenibacillus sp. LHD-38]|uniref:LysM peptidoglycan-binding domain-containing protein n=1 Tax=Paenibacillus sp. LHD-38 TaxID=3072143 RepID=UPI00280FFD9B|nr:LysM peptidoglycan-binding domain-containing protein [Paenibacillus sp. LHD-38]MDQ8737384.1 LysM peptidoglycan-binding domain-containing protein [Paenibacillus sp. LHD-38]